MESLFWPLSFPQALYHRKGGCLLHLCSFWVSGELHLSGWPSSLWTVGWRRQQFNQLTKDWLRIYTGEAQRFDKMIPPFLLSINFQEPKFDTGTLGRGLSHTLSLSLSGIWTLSVLVVPYFDTLPLTLKNNNIVMLLILLSRKSIHFNRCFVFVFLRLQLTCPTNILPAATTDSIGDDPIVTSITHPT